MKRTHFSLYYEKLDRKRYERWEGSDAGKLRTLKLRTLKGSDVGKVRTLESFGWRSFGRWEGSDTENLWTRASLY